MAKKEASQSPADWDLVVEGIGKKFGKGISFFRLGDERSKILSVKPIPTYLPQLDNALGIFGYPIGRIIEIYGPESGGKTTLALQACAAAQKAMPDRPIVYIDMEHSLDTVWAAKNGANPSLFNIVQPDSGEQAAQIAITVAESGHPSLIVLDSIAAMVPQAELEGEMTDLQMGASARIIGKFCRKIVGPLQRNGVTLICINQTRMKLGPVPGEERPGGKAIRFFASQVLRVRSEKKIMQGGEIIGIWIEVVLRKNKVAQPFRVAMVPLIFGEGISRSMATLEAAVEDGIIDKSGAWYSYNGDRLGQGVVNAAQALDEESMVSVYEAFKTKRLENIEMVEPEEPEDA